jgi:hypothetical protein
MKIHEAQAEMQQIGTSPPHQPRRRSSPISCSTKQQTEQLSKAVKFRI